MPSPQSLRAGKAVIELSLLKGPAEKGLRQLQAKMKHFGGVIQGIGAKMLAVGGTMATSFAIPIKAASDLQETMNKFNVVFGNSSMAVKAWSDNFAKEIGRSKNQVASFLAGSQDLFIPLGFEPGAAEDMSKQITKLAIDLASFNNLDDGAVLRDLHAALTGSGEVMKKYGVIVSEAAVKQEILNRGMDPKVATDQQKVMARLNIIMRGTTSAQGDAARSADSVANRMKALKARVTDLLGEIGTALLPMTAKLLQKAQAVIKSISNWASKNQALIISVASLSVKLVALGAAVYGVGAAMKAWSAIIGITTAMVNGLSKASALLSVGIKGVGIALSFIKAHPVIAAVSAIVAAVVALMGSLKKANKEIKQTISLMDELESKTSRTGKQEDLLKTGDQSRRRIIEIIDSLRKWQKFGKIFSKRHIDEVRGLLDELQGLHGHTFGIGLDFDENDLPSIHVNERQFKRLFDAPDDSRRRLDTFGGKALFELGILAARLKSEIATAEKLSPKEQREAGLSQMLVRLSQVEERMAKIKAGNRDAMFNDPSRPVLAEGNKELGQGKSILDSLRAKIDEAADEGGSFIRQSLIKAGRAINFGNAFVDEKLNAMNEFMEGKKGKLEQGPALDHMETAMFDTRLLRQMIQPEQRVDNIPNKQLDVMLKNEKHLKKIAGKEGGMVAG